MKNSNIRIGFGLKFNICVGTCSNFDICTSLYFYRLILLPDQAKASLATHFLAYIKGIGYNTKYEASNDWLYLKKKKISHVELYFPYCVAYYDDIIKNMTCRHCRNSILYVT